MTSKSVDNIEKEFRNLTLNKGIIISFFVYLGYLLFYLIYSFKQFLPVSITIFGYLLIHGLLYLILNKAKYLLVRISFLILSVLFLVNLTFFIAGPKTGVHYFLLIFSLLALSMARPERLWISVLYFSVSLFFFAGAEFGFLPDMSIVDYPKDLAYIIRVECIISSFVIIYFVSYMFYRINIEKERHIVSQNNELYRVNEKLEQTQNEISLQNEQMRSLNEELIANIDIISIQKQELEVANSTKEKFFSIIAHDVKNPLSSIIGLTELLQLNVGSYPIEKLKEYLKVVHESANRIDTVIRNLISNAIKFTPENRTITLQDEVNDDSIQLDIIDTGIGMDDQTLSSAFKKNKSISYGTNEERGMGLGLLICKEFLEMNDCQLLIKSVPQKGSTFSVLFPN